MSDQPGNPVRAYTDVVAEEAAAAASSTRSAAAKKAAATRAERAQDADNPADSNTGGGDIRSTDRA